MSLLSVPAIGFAGDVLLLLELVQRQQIDLRTLDLVGLINQLAEAVVAEAAGPLSQRAGWMVTGAELLRLRSALMLPVRDHRHQQAQDTATRLQQVLQARAEAMALADWLMERAARQPPTWRRGRAELAQAKPGDDLLQFLWGCVGVFSGFGLQGEEGEPPERYVVTPFPFWRFDDALARVREQLTQPPHVATLRALAPPEAGSVAAKPQRALQRRAAWASTFLACLELAREGRVALEVCPPQQGNVLVRAESPRGASTTKAHHT